MSLVRVFYTWRQADGSVRDHPKHERGVGEVCAGTQGRAGSTRLCLLQGPRPVGHGVSADLIMIVNTCVRPLLQHS